MARKWAIVVLCLSSWAWAETARPTVIAAPLELDPNPALIKVEPELKALFGSLFRDRAGVLPLSPKEAEAALKETKRQDFREANESLALLATKGGAMYALWVWVQYTPTKELVLTGRVVRDDGKLMKTAHVQMAKHEDTIVGVCRPLILALFDSLELKNLPIFKEAPTAEVKPDGRKSEQREEHGKSENFPPPPPPPVLERTAAPTSRVAAYVLAGVGAAGVVTGAVVYMIAGTVRFDGHGNVLAEDVSKVREVQAGQSLGVGILGVGAAMAVAGAVLWAATPAQVQVSLAPTRDGAMVVFGGALP